MEIKQYLAIIRKSDFVDLFKYGWIYIRRSVPFNGDINRKDLFKKLTEEMNNYEYSFEYLIINFLSESAEKVDIDKVNCVYALDEQARKEMASSLDYRIHIQVSPWAEDFKLLNFEQNKINSLRGIDNLWKIFNLPIEEKEKCKEIISKGVQDEVFRELSQNTRPAGDLPIWAYLLRYERHSYYPNDIRGFFCDSIHVFMNRLKKQEQQDGCAEQSDAYKKIVECDPKLQFSSILDIIKRTKFTQITEEKTGCNYVVVAPLFLFLKHEFSDGFNIRDTRYKGVIEHTKTFGLHECSLAIYMLGLTLGYDKTYDAYYDKINLPIFRPIECTSDDANFDTEHENDGFEAQSKGNSSTGASASKAPSTSSADDQTPQAASTNGVDNKETSNQSISQPAPDGTSSDTEVENNRTETQIAKSSIGESASKATSSSKAGEQTQDVFNNTEKAKDITSKELERKEFDRSNSVAFLSDNQHDLFGEGRKTIYAQVHKGKKGSKGYVGQNVYSKEELDIKLAEGYKKYVNIDPNRSF